MIISVENLFRFGFLQVLLIFRFLILPLTMEIYLSQDQFQMRFGTGTACF